MVVVIPVLVFAAIGALFGLGLAFASQKLAVKADERVPLVRDCLPGANCGACGLPGCDALAAAIVEGNAKANACPVGGLASAEAISAIMGMEAEAPVKMVANIICRGGLEKCLVRFDYAGEDSCKATALTSGGDKACRYACLGHGDCEKVCPFGAIIVTHDRLAWVDESKCTGCGLCVASCPKDVLRLEPHYVVRVKCRAMEKGRAVMDACKAGCIACGKCSKVCNHGAVTVIGNLPVIDRQQCVECGDCAKACPTGAMYAEKME